MSRLQTGSMDVIDRTADVSDVVDAAVASLGPRAAAVTSDVPDDLPRIRYRPGLLERAVANLIDNALIHAGGTGLRIEAGAVAGRVDLRVIDHGPGIPAGGPRPGVPTVPTAGGLPRTEAGVGLGLAVARGFVEAVGGDLDVDDTPGGGCTMVVRLPAAPPADNGPGADPEHETMQSAVAAPGDQPGPEPPERTSIGRQEPQ